MMNMKKSENVYYSKDNLLDYLTEDDIAIFVCKSKDFENSKAITVHIMDRENDTIVCWVFDENDRKIFLKLTPFITYVITHENFCIDYGFWSNCECYWQAYLYRLFGQSYMDIIKKRNRSNMAKNNDFREKEMIYQNFGDLMWPYISSKELTRKRSINY